MGKYRVLFFGVVSLLVLLAFHSVSHAGEESSKKILVCSTTQIADFARNIVGDDCVVKCILAPGADPHTYSPTPDDIKMVTSSDLCLENGLHLEGKNWMANLASKAGKPVITCTDGVKPILIKSEGQKINDPHAWFSITNVVVYVNNITRALIKIEPDKKESYVARAKLFLQQLRVLDSWMKQQFTRIPPERRVLVTSHDAFNYFCREFGFNANHDYISLAPVGWSTGSEIGAGVTPERHKKVVASIRSYGAKAIFMETSVNPKQIRSVAKEAGVKIGGKLYSDSMGEAGAAGETYIGMMRENTITIINALLPDKTEKKEAGK